MSDIELRGITERDIDLLLLEELVASREFSEWFGAQAGIDASHHLAGVSRSVIASSGESDLEVTYRRDNALTRLLVENKIDAAFQNRQAERYRERAEKYVLRGDCKRAVTMVIAPESYARTIGGFDKAVTYEDVRMWFANAATGDARWTYKLKLIDAAIQRGEGGWKLVPDEATTAFWLAYWALAVEVAPDLRMPKPGKKPATSSFLRFRPTGLPKGVSLIHKVPYGNVDLQSAGQAGRIDAFVAQYEPRLERGMSIARANKSLVVRIAVPPVSLESRFAEVRPELLVGLKAAVQLLVWARRHLS